MLWVVSYTVSQSEAFYLTTSFKKTVSIDHSDFPELVNRKDISCMSQHPVRRRGEKSVFSQGLLSGLELTFYTPNTEPRILVCSVYTPACGILRGGHVSG